MGTTPCPRCPVRAVEARKSVEGGITCEGGFNQCAFDIAGAVPIKGPCQSENIPSPEGSRTRVLRVYLSLPIEGLPQLHRDLLNLLELTPTPLPSIGRFGLLQDGI